VNGAILDVREGWTSASNAQADALCPARHLSQKVAKVNGALNGGVEESSPDAQTGTRIHEALAKGDPAGLSVNETDTFDACRQIEAKLVNGYFGADVPEPLRHHRFWLALSGWKHSGECDVAWIGGRKAMILDYKVLAGDVAESPRNEQLRDLSVLLWCENRNIEEIAVAIVQPLVTHRPVPCVYDLDSLEHAMHDLSIRVAASNAVDSEPMAGEVQCKFCTAKSRCLAYQHYFGATVPGMASLLDVPVAEWSPQQRAIFCKKFDAAQKWLDNTWAEMERLAMADQFAIPGYRMFDRTWRENITNPQKAFERFAALGGNIDGFMRAVIVKKGELKTEINKVTGAKGMALDKALDAICDGIVDRKQTKPSLKAIK
jgi:hypothetical protein